MRSVALFLFWTALFCLSYTQAPLYSGNQTGYFLHGLAQGGRGFLREDWQANAADLLPVFSFLVKVTYRYLDGSLFFLYYALLMGLYLYCLKEIASTVVPDLTRREKGLGFYALIIALHSAVYRYFCGRLFPPRFAWDMQYLFQFGVARQYILGPVFQPSTVGVFLLLSILLFLRGRSFYAVLVACMTSTLHPTYLFGSGVLIFSYLFLLWKQDRQVKRVIGLGLFAGLLLLPVLLYMTSVFGPVVPEIHAKSLEILSERLSPHAIPSRWINWTVFLKIGLILPAIFLSRKKPLFSILLWNFTAATVLTLFQMISKSRTLAFVFPWRLSVYLVPIAVAVLAAVLTSSIVDKSVSRNRFFRARWSLLCWVVITGCAAGGVVLMDREWKSLRREESVGMMDFVQQRKTSGETYLIPIALERFRLYTGAPIFVDYKSQPYEDSRLVEWQKRIDLANRFYEKGFDCRLLKELSLRYRITHAVIPAESSFPGCPFLKEIYRDRYYRVFSINLP